MNSKEESDTTNEKQKIEINTVPAPFSLREVINNIAINTNIVSTLSKEEIINQALKYHINGDILNAAKFYQYFIGKGFSNHAVYCNYGIILNNLGKKKEAEYLREKQLK